MDVSLYAELFYMRCWIGLVGLIAVFNGLKCFVDWTYTRKRLYTLKPMEAGALFTRMFGTWTILAGVIRVSFAFSTPTLSLYLLTFFSFLLAFFHFALEVFVTKTAPLGFATASPLLISGGSMLWMLPTLSKLLLQ